MKVTALPKRNALFSRATLAVAVMLTASSANAQLLGNRPFMESVDKSLSAAFSGPTCGNEVGFTFTGKDRATFNKDGVATRLMNNVVTSLRRTCPRVGLVAAKGQVGGDVVYNAIAEAEGGWLLLELGSNRDASVLSGGDRGNAGDRAAFSRRRDFTGFGALLTATRGKPWLCSGQDAGSCTSASEFKNASEDGATVVARSLVDGGGTQAVLTYPAANRGGLLCSNPQTAKIEIVGGTASAAARNRMATDLRERLKPYGNEVCSGYAMRGGQIVSANFNAGGARIGQEALLTALTAQPRLRQDK